MTDSYKIGEGKVKMGEKNERRMCGEVNKKLKEKLRGKKELVKGK